MGQWPRRKRLLPADYSELFRQTLMDSCLRTTLHVLVNHRGPNSLLKCELENQMPFLDFFFPNFSFLPHHFSLHCTICLTLSKNTLSVPGTDGGTAHLTDPRCQPPSSSKAGSPPSLAIRVTGPSKFGFSGSSNVK